MTELSFYGKNEKWKNELEDILQIVWEFFNLKTQYPGPLFDSGFWGLITVERAKFSRKASRLGYLLFKFTPKCGMLLFVKPFFLMPTWLTKATTNVQNCIRKNFRFFLTRMYLFIWNTSSFWKRLINKMQLPSLKIFFCIIKPEKNIYRIPNRLSRESHIFVENWQKVKLIINF